MNQESQPSNNPSEGQPDVEPEVPSNTSQPSTPIQEIHQEHHPMPFSSNSEEITEDDPAANTPIPNDNADDELICEGLHCVDLDIDPCFVAEEVDLAWRCEVLVTADDICTWQDEADPSEMAFVVSAAKKQRSEVKMSTLNAQEKEQFQKAKEAEVQNWLKTGTVSRILRDKVPHEQILRCRWILTWKPVDDDKQSTTASPNKVKAKARLVILGYLDPKLEELPRDSPTLGRNACCRYS